MYNGFTGKRLEVMIFLNPTFYQRLKHMSSLNRKGSLSRSVYWSENMREASV